MVNLSDAARSYPASLGILRPEADEATAPGQGRIDIRSHTSGELAALQETADRMGISFDQILGILGNETSDV